MHACISFHTCTPAGLRSAHDTVQAKSLRLACKTSSLAGTKLPQRQQSLLARQRSVTRRQTTMGLPIPIVGRYFADLQVSALLGTRFKHVLHAGPLFNPFFAFVAYALGAAR